MDYTQLIESMRSFEADHKPDGWPAIRMHFVSEMCDAIKALQAERDALQAQVDKLSSWTGGGIEVSLDAWKSLNADVEALQAQLTTEHMNCAMADQAVTKMAAKLAALEAQEPVGYAHPGQLACIELGYAYVYPKQQQAASQPLYLAAGAQPSTTAPTVPDKTALRDLITSHLTCVYVCTRVWEAWNVGTMTEADFIEATETDFADDLIEAMLPLLEAAPTGEQTAPLAAGAQAQPLTAQQLEDLANQHYPSMTYYTSFARAIEAAHKIGGSV